MCCGSKRTAWRYGSTPVQAAPAGPQIPQGTGDGEGSPGVGSPQAPFHSVTLHYTQDPAIRVRGPVTGQAYAFSGAQPAQAVDVRDAAVLTRGALFRRG